MYKIISKIITYRLKKIISKLISKCQAIFIPQRQMLDGVVVINEILEYGKRKKMNCMLVKVEFEKAYDCVS